MSCASGKYELYRDAIAIPQNPANTANTFLALSMPVKAVET